VLYTIIRILCVLLAATVSESDTVQINISLPFTILAMTFHNKFMCVFQVSHMGEVGFSVRATRNYVLSLFLIVFLFIYIRHYAASRKVAG
jgi:hypothetical protein